METINLATLYDSPPMEWDVVRRRLDAGFDQTPGAGGPDRHTTWLTTLNRDGSPHVNGLGAVWDEGRFWFVTGLDTKRGRNLLREPRCALALSVHEFDLVVEGVATVIDDPPEVARLAARWSGEGWPCAVDDSGRALTAPYSAQSAGPPPWHIFAMTTHSAHAVQTVLPHGACRWHF